MPDKTAVSAGAIILREIDGQLKIALAQRNQVIKPEKTWVIPKGHVEYGRGETIEQAVHREVFEETGLTSVQLIRYLGSVERPSTRAAISIIKTIHYYLAYSPNHSGTASPSDERFREVGWFPPQQALDLMPHDVERTFFKEELPHLFQA